MFQKGELIVYGNTGVCRVQEIGHPEGLRNIDKGRLYYTLAPVYQSGVIYAPVDTAVFMRPVLSCREAEELILQIPAISEKECGSRDQKTISDHYRGFLSSHRCEDLVQLIKTVYTKPNGPAKTAQSPPRWISSTSSGPRGFCTAILPWPWGSIPARWCPTSTASSARRRRPPPDLPGPPAADYLRYWGAFCRPCPLCSAGTLPAATPCPGQALLYTGRRRVLQYATALSNGSSYL